MSLKARFEIIQKLGEGSFSKIFEAYDNLLNRKVALKMEKQDKSKKILRFEYEFLKKLQGLKHIPQVFDFITSENSNFIVLECLGQNIANYKKSKSKINKKISPYEILLQMLSAIEEVHEAGIIHRDIKPTNFVIGIDKKEDIVYIVDFGLSKIHLDKNKTPLPPRSDTDFRGTLTYASLNAHYKKELSRRDDMWSFFFVILDLLDESLPWRNYKDEKDEIQNMKEVCLSNPIKNLFLTSMKNNNNILEIFNHLNSLKYEDKPDYSLIKNLIKDMQREVRYEKKKINYSQLSNPIFDLINFNFPINSENNEKSPNEIQNLDSPSTIFMNNFIKNYSHLEASAIPPSSNDNNLKTFLREKRKRDGHKEMKDKINDTNNNVIDNSIIISKFLTENENNSSITNITNEFLKSVFSKVEKIVKLNPQNLPKNSNYNKYKYSKAVPHKNKQFYDNLNLQIDKNLINYMMKNLDDISNISKIPNKQTN